jgi:hypothetical protein
MHRCVREDGAEEGGQVGLVESVALEYACLERRGFLLGLRGRVGRLFGGLLGYPLWAIAVEVVLLARGAGDRSNEYCTDLVHQ